MVVLRIRLSILAENPERQRGNTERPFFILVLKDKVFWPRMYKKPSLAIVKRKLFIAREGLVITLGYYGSRMHPNLPVINRI